MKRVGDAPMSRDEGDRIADAVLELVRSLVAWRDDEPASPPVPEVRHISGRRRARPCRKVAA